MTCYFPLTAYRSRTPNPSGKYSLVFSPKDGYVDQSFPVPCGRCEGCRLERSRQWAVRCLFESKLYDENCFVTLTYDNEHLPCDGSVHVEHFQKFMKRLRKKYSDRKVRFFHCGEYGGQTERPHYHAILFNIDFPDRKFHTINGQGDKIYSSELLADLWPSGFCTIGDVTFRSAGYVARYITKKVLGDTSEDHYRGRKPEYCTSSQGIGRGWYDKFKSDLYPSDFVVIDGKKQVIPQYFDRLFERENPKEFQKLKALRRQKAIDNPDSSYRRLDDRWICLKSRIKTLSRSMENADGL